MAGNPLTSTERYELADRIAVGGMAEVFRAKAIGAHGFEKQLAIKRILPDLARDPEFEQRFIAEAKLAVKLTHANVVQVLDFGHLGGTLFIAMELIDGVDLAVLLRHYRDRGEQVPLPAAFHIAIEIGRGLDYAHQQGVVHRDVSPSNILLSRAGEVKIADFGIATAGDLRSGPIGHRRIMGKWRYMSPEQSRGEAMAAPSDLFSAAAVMFEVFTGEKLFPGDDAETIVANIRRMSVPRASERRKSLPPRLDDVLGCALERDPGKRPRRSAELLRALIEISYDSSIVASSLDVADAVRQVCGDPLGVSGVRPARAASKIGLGQGKGGIDRMIAAQLGAAPEPGRSTAVGAAPPLDGNTGSLIRRVDADGITHLEPDRATIAAGPSALKRVARITAAPDGGERRTGRRLAIGGGVALLAGAIAVAVVALDRGEPPVARPAAPADAGPVAPTAELDIDSVPAGAQVKIDGVALPRPTPTRATVVADTPHRVAFSLAGYQAYVDEGVTARRGERLRLLAALVPLRARLEVITLPPGATVMVAGQRLGETPLVRDDLPPGKLALTLELEGHRREEVAVVLAEGEPQRIERKLKSSVVYGRVNLNIVDSWAEVSQGDRLLGRAPGTFKLPVGAHQLRLHNPASGKSRDIAVEVVADKVNYFSFEL